MGKFFMDCRHKNADGITTLQRDNMGQHIIRSHCTQCGQLFSVLQEASLIKANNSTSLAVQKEVKAETDGASKASVETNAISELHKTMDRLKSGAGVDLAKEVKSLHVDLARLTAENQAANAMITKLQAALGKEMKDMNVNEQKIHCVTLELNSANIVPLNVKEVHRDQKGLHILVTGAFQQL